MLNKSYGDLLDHVKKTLDLQEELFISNEEFLLYVEEAIRFCEAEVHKLNIEDQYFETVRPLALVQGRAEYPFPENIYANKILRLIYDNGSKIYSIPRIRDRYRYERGAQIDRDNTSLDYGYRIVNNDIRVGPKVRLYPRSNETSAVTVLTGSVSEGTNIVTGLSSTSALSAGYFVSGTGIANSTRLLSVDSATQVSLEADAYEDAAACHMLVH